MPGDCVLGIDCDKNTSASGGQGPRNPWTLCIHNFQAIISFLTSGTVSMSLYAVVLLKVGGGGGAKSSVNLVMGSWHP